MGNWESGTGCWWRTTESTRRNYPQNAGGAERSETVLRHEERAGMLGRKAHRYTSRLAGDINGVFAPTPGPEAAPRRETPPKMPSDALPHPAPASTPSGAFSGHPGEIPSGGKKRRRPAYVPSPAPTPEAVAAQRREDEQRATYKRVWERFRLDGSETATAADTGVSLQVVKRYVAYGIPALNPPLPSLRAHLDTQTRAAVARTESKTSPAVNVETSTTAELVVEREKAATDAAKRVKDAIGDAVQQREDEGRLVRANRESALLLAMVQARLLRGSVKLAERLEKQIADEAMPVKEGLRVLHAIGSIAKSTAEVSRHAVHMERLLLGKPTDIIGGTVTSNADETPEEALEVAIRAFARRDARKTVLDALPAGEESGSYPDV